jgi:Zn-dependent M28 family amino/carboxypeptidase
MKKTLCLSLLSIFIINCSSKKNVAVVEVKPIPAVKTVEDPIRDYLKTINIENLKENLSTIASDEMEGRETGSKGQKKAGNYIINQYKSHGIRFPKGATDYYQKVPAAFLNAKSNENLPDSENIWAFIEGTEKPDEIVVVSAHYDHVGTKNGEVYNGADDDGSGTVALIEIAKAFQKANKDGYGPKRSVLILHVTGEEHGLHGSRYYSENPLFPIKNTVADVNIDMIGRRDDLHKDSNNYIYLIGADYLSSDLAAICEEANKKYIATKLDYKFNDRNDSNRFYYRSDHYNFAKNGIPSVFLFNGVHADYHKATDEVEKIEFDALTKRTQLAFAIAWEIANREKRIVVDKDGR